MGLFGAGTSTIGTGIVFTLQDQFSNTADKISRKFTKLDAITEKVTKRVNKNLNNMKMGFAALLVGAALVLPFTGAINQSMEFSAAMSEVGAKSNATSVDLRILTDEALRLGEATKFSAKQVAEGQAFLAMAGFRSSQIIQAMPGMLELAASGNLDLALAADIASNVLTQFNMVAAKTGQVADIMAFAATNSNTSVTEMAEAMKFLGPTAAAYGVSLSEATASTMSLANAGLKGGMATRAFGTSLANLSNPTRKMQTMMDELNISFFDAKGNFVGINNVIGELEKGMQGLTQQQRMAAINTIFQAGSIQEVNALLNAQVDVMRNGESVTLKGSEALKEYTRQLETSGGTASRVSKQMLDNLKGDITIIQSALETTAIKIGDAFNAILRPLVQFFTIIISLAGKLASHPIGKWLIRILAVTGALLMVIGALVVSINAVGFASAKAALAFIAMGKAEIGAAFATKGLIGGIRALAVSLWTALAPFWPFLVVGAALIAVFIIMRKAAKSFSDVLNGNVEPATKGWLAVMQKLGGVIKGVAMIWSSATREGFTLTGQMKDALESLGILDFVVNLGTWIVRMKAFFTGLWDGVMIVVNAIQSVFSVIWDSFDLLGTALSKIGININKNTSDINKWAKAGKIAAFVIGGIILAKIILLTVAMWNLAAAVIGATWPVLAIIAIIAALAFGIVKLVQNWDQVISWMQNTWSSFISWLGDVWTGFVDWLLALPQRFFQWGQDFVNSIWSGIKSVWGNLQSWFNQMIEALMQPIISTLQMFGILDGSEANVNVNSNNQVNEPTSLGRTFAENQASQVVNNTDRTVTNTEREIVRNIQLVMPDGRILTEIVNEENDLTNFRENG